MGICATINGYLWFFRKQGRKRSLYTPERKIERRKREKKEREEGERERERQ